MYYVLGEVIGVLNVLLGVLYMTCVLYMCQIPTLACPGSLGGLGVPVRCTCVLGVPVRCTCVLGVPVHCTCVLGVPVHCTCVLGIPVRCTCVLGVPVRCSVLYMCVRGPSTL